MIAAHISRNQLGHAVTMLALTYQERTQLRAILDKVLESVEGDKNAFEAMSGPGRGRLIRDGVDITELTFETERVAREFRRRL